MGVWWVTGTDYRAINPQRPQDCPRTGHVLDLDTTVVAATMVTLGATAVASRDGLGITPAGQDARDAAARAFAESTVDPTPQGRATGLGLWREALLAERSPPGRRAARRRPGRRARA